MRADTPKLIAVAAVVVIALCAIISTVTLVNMNKRVGDLYNVTAKPHCYLSPNDPRRREIERGWGTEPTSEGTCDKDNRKAD